jgi:hypothetical protein
MQTTAIDATLKQLAAQLPKGQTKQSTDVFQSLVDTLSSQIKTAIADAAAGSGSTAAAPSTPTTASPDTALGTTSVRTTSQLNPFQQSLLRNAGAPMFEQLSSDLTASDPRYNEREAQLRDGLDLGGIEQRLRASAKGFGVEYDSSDLDGILRNAGYGAAHLGSTERYMAAVEKFVGEAEKNYRERAGNTPGRV